MATATGNVAVSRATPLCLWNLRDWPSALKAPLGAELKQPVYSFGGMKPLFC